MDRYVTELEAQQAGLGIRDVVKFVGFVSGIAEDSIYRRADICVLPSIETSDGDAEGLPVSLL